MNVILGVINDLDKNKVGELYIEKLLNLTDFWIFNAKLDLKKNNIHMDVFYFETEQGFLDFASNHNYEFAIGNWIGHLLRPAKNGDKHVILDTINFCKNTDGLIGHIISYTDKLPYFYKEFWCVNLNIYKELGYPKWEVNDNTEFPNFNRSSENFHDDYTPFYINTAEGYTKNTIQISWGTGLIKAWLKNNRTINNFPKEIRELKHHLYPENHEILTDYFDSKVCVEDLTQPLQKQYFRSIDYDNSKNCIFLFNTDSLDFDPPKTLINNLVTVCAAFRPYLILHECGFNNSTKVKFIDYSEISLQFKKWLVENWDGIDIFKAVTSFEKEIGKPMNWNKPFHLTYQQSHNEVINKFGGAEKWLKFWNEYKQLEHEYHLIDLVSDLNKIENLLSDNQNYIYFSNSYNTEAGLVKWGKTKLKKSLFELVEIAEKTNSILDGSDVDHHYPDPDFAQKIKQYYEY